jgi:hypothetical protein
MDFGNISLAPDSRPRMELYDVRILSKQIMAETIGLRGQTPCRVFGAGQVRWSLQSDGLFICIIFSLFYAHNWNIFTKCSFPTILKLFTILTEHLSIRKQPRTDDVVVYRRGLIPTSTISCIASNGSASQKRSRAEIVPKKKSVQDTSACMVVSFSFS